MPEVFDPYRKWLGIAPHEQPAHLYRLLGLAPFEDDADVIQNAADRQMAHVRTFQNGPNGRLTQRILSELAQAKLTLLDRDKKARYDAQLRAHAGLRTALPEAPDHAAASPAAATAADPQAPVIIQGPPAAPAIPGVPKLRPSVAEQARRRNRRSQIGLLMFLLLLLATGTAVGAILWLQTADFVRP